MFSPNDQKHVIVSLPPFLIFFLLGWVGSAGMIAAKVQEVKKQEKKAVAGFIGSETCQTCHEEQAKWLQRSVHQAVMKDSTKTDGTAGCESCHGPGSIHAEEPAKTNILTFKTEAASSRSNACLACHGKKSGLIDFQRTAHRSQQISCDQCHSQGQSEKFHSMRDMEEIMPMENSSLCRDCHQEVQADFSKPFRHRVKEGYLKCIDCHEIHGGFRAGKNRNEQNNETCAKCHPEKEGPFLYEHVPSRVGGGCMSCHTPHGSTNPRMLTRHNILTLCMECHTGLPTFHNLTQERYRNCTTCHPAIHGSNHSKNFME